MTKQQLATRREFAKTAVAASSVFAVPAILRGRNLNEKLNIAVIGCGGRGASNMRGVESENIVALCDVNGNNLGFGLHRLPQVDAFPDFRLLFDSVSK